MKRFTWAWLLILTLAAPPVWADESDADDKDQEEVAELATDEQEAEEEESPIKRLAEVRIDQFVVPARTINIPLPGRTRTLQDLLDQLDKLAENDDIGAVMLDLGPVSLPMADVEELQAGVEKLRKADKKVVAFVNAGGPLAYLLACSADEIVIAPTGNVIIPGLGMVFPFMKGYYQMLGLEFDVITAGKYKYGGFLNRRKPDEYFQEEFGAILDSWIGDYKRIIAEGRGLSSKTVDELVDIALFDADDAMERGLVDAIGFYDEYRDRILRREKMKKHVGWEFDMSRVNSIQDLVELINRGLKEAEEEQRALGPKIAVLHARGPIVDFSLGVGFASQLICRDDFVEVVDNLRKNRSIKAVVLRIDSPGGSGYASDMIWKSLRRLGEEKPLVVSMGSVAGSGGYYIACPAHRIYAQPTTLTGSIGVIGMFQSAWSRYNRMDYEFAEMKRGARSLLGSAHRDLSEEDRAFIQKYMNDFYSFFVDRVAKTRKMPEAEVRRIAEGRIYSGRDALDIGLVDELGGLADAIESARAMTNIPPSAELKIVHYPRPGSLGEIFESFSAVGVTTLTDAMARAASPATPVTFDQQARIFAQQPIPLCWMGVPPIWEPQPQLTVPAYQLLGLPKPTSPLETVLPQLP